MRQSRAAVYRCGGASSLSCPVPPCLSPCHRAGPAQALSSGADGCIKQQFALHPPERQGMSCSSGFLRGCWVVAVQQPLQPLSSALEVTEVHCDVLWSLFVNCWMLRRGLVFQELASCYVLHLCAVTAAAGCGEWPLLVALLWLGCFFPLDPISFPQKK